MSLTGPPYADRSRFVYDLAYPGDYRYWKYVYDNLTVQDVTFGSGTEVERVNETFGSTGTRATACEFESLPTNATQFAVLHEGDNTDFDREFITTTDYDAIVMDIQFNYGICMNVSAYTSDNFTIDSIDHVIQSFKSTGTLAFQWSRTWASSLAAMTAVDNQLFIVQDVMKSPFPIYRGGAVTTRIIVNVTRGVGTSQVGIVPVFPYQATGALRVASEAGYRVLLQPMPSRREIMTEGPYTRY